MKKPITIAIAILLFILICWGTYSYITNAKQKVFNAGGQIGTIYGYGTGFNNGFTAGNDSVIIKALNQIEKEGKLTISNNEQTIHLTESK